MAAFVALSRNGTTHRVAQRARPRGPLAPLRRRRRAALVADLPGHALPAAAGEARPLPAPAPPAATPAAAAAAAAAPAAAAAALAHRLRRRLEQLHVHRLARGQGEEQRNFKTICSKQ